MGFSRRTGLNSNLDYSFTVVHEDGTFVLPANLPAQLRIPGDSVRGLDFLKTAPRPRTVQGGLADGLSPFILAETAWQYGGYLCRDTRLAEPTAAEVLLDLLAGTYQLTRLKTLAGVAGRLQLLRHDGGTVRLSYPTFAEGVALRAVSA